MSSLVDAKECLAMICIHGVQCSLVVWSGNEAEVKLDLVCCSYHRANSRHSVTKRHVVHCWCHAGKLLL